MATLKFSVGKISYKDAGDPDYTEIGVCTDITVSYDGAPVEFRGGDYRYPVDIQLGNQTLTVTGTCGDSDSAEEPLNNKITEIKIEPGQNSGGISTITLSNMKLVSKEVASTQDGFVTTAYEWHKVAS